MIKYFLSLCSILILFIPNSQATSILKGMMSQFDLDTTPKPIMLNELSTEEIFKIVEYMPHFAGCEEIEDKLERKQCSDEKIIEFINKNIKYPAEAREEGIQGIAVIRFVVETDGSLHFKENKSILRDPGGGCGEEALRVVQAMPDWIPGRQKGQLVRVQFTLPIKYQLTDGPKASKKLEFQKAVIKWDGYEIEGQYKTEDPSAYVKAECTLDKAMEIMSARTKGIPLMLKLAGGEKKGFTQYYLSVGKKGKKHLVSSITKNKGLKQKIKKALKSEEVIYFYNWEYKKTVVEILVK